MPARVPNRKSKHSLHLLDTKIAILLIKMQNHFGIRRGAERISSLDQILAQFGCIVGFPVVGDPHGARQDWTSAGGRGRSGPKSRGGCWPTGIRPKRSRHSYRGRDAEGRRPSSAPPEAVSPRKHRQPGRRYRTSAYNPPAKTAAFCTPAAFAVRGTLCGSRAKWGKRKSTPMRSQR